MKMTLIFSIAATLVANSLLAATPQEQARQRDEAAVKQALDGWYTQALPMRDQRLQWWREARFGCFVHWGVYADPAGEYKGRRGGSYSEHLMRQLTIPREEYLKEIAGPFNPTKFDADEWIRLVKAAGMRYFIITAKHHDGFAMYPSDVSRFDIADATKFKRDPMKELSQACRKHGVHFGFYYSHAFDWEHPDAPGNDWDYENPGGDKHLFDEKIGPNRWRYWYDVHPEMVPRFRKYVDEKAIPQLLELIDKYKPDIFWFDTSGKLPVSEQLRIVRAVREKAPNVVINGRAARGMSRNFGDYVNTADNPAEVRATEGDWEAIPTVNNSYGYSKWDKNYKSPEFFIRLIARITAKGGNSLLNVGPMGNGEIDPEAVKILQGIGKWFDTNGESIHGCSRTPLDRQAWGDSTINNNTVYLHVFQWPRDGKLVVGGLQGDVKKAYLLADVAKTPLAVSHRNDNDLEVAVPSQAPDAVDSVVVLEMNGEPRTTKGRLLATNIAENQLLAFDAAAQGKFSYGDGKAGRYYASGFTEANDALVWPIRLNAPATFEVSVRHGATKPVTLQLTAGNQTLATRLEALKDARQNELASLGELKLPAGEFELRCKPEHPVEMSLFELILKPAAATTASSWRPIFNGKDLTGWYTWLKDAGKDSDPTKIFQVHDGVLHIYKDAPEASDQPFGYVSTVEEFGDCRIRLQYKWGTKRFGGRATKKRDSGLLYFTLGPDGPDGKTWPHSVECQIQEGDTGDIFAIGTACSSTIDSSTATATAPTFKDAGEGGIAYTTPGKMNDRIIRSEMLEKESDWNTVEVVLEGDSAVHIVNGKSNMKIIRATRPVAGQPGQWQPLRRGRIVLQAEGAEVMYRNIEVQPLK